MLLLRRVHAYIGLFIAPSVLFFALSGALQLFNLHESRGSYRAPLLFQYMGSIHKDQVFAPSHDHGPPQPAPGAQPNPQPPGGGDHHPDSIGTTLLKWFFLAVALGLATTTAAGIFLALKTTRRRQLSWSLILTGTAIPLILLLA